MNTNPLVDKYIASFPQNVQVILEKIRQIVIMAAPDAQENLSYGIPTYKQNKNLVHFAGYKNHIGFYPGPRAIEFFKKDLIMYQTSKGTIKFSLSDTIPYTLISRITKHRVKEMIKYSQKHN